jgi:Ni/Co efflux regulator RcnB
MVKKQSVNTVNNNYIRTIDVTIGFAVVSLAFIWTMIMGPVYNHFYPDSKIYYLILFQSLVFITDIVALVCLPIVNRRSAPNILTTTHNAYNSSKSVVVSLISLYMIGLAVSIGGWIWRLVIYNQCLNRPATDECRTGSNGDTALVLLLFDILNIVPVIGAIITLFFALSFLKSMNHKKAQLDKPHTHKKKDEPKEEEVEETEEEEEESDSEKSEEESTKTKSRYAKGGYMPPMNERGMPAQVVSQDFWS